MKNRFFKEKYIKPHKVQETPVYERASIYSRMLKTCDTMFDLAIYIANKTGV